MGAKGKTRVFPLLPIGKIFVLAAIIFMINAEGALADSASYFFDDLGRLTRVLKGTFGTIYKYDSLGNLVTVTSTTTTAGSPILNTASPNVLFAGSKLLVTLTGQNLFSTETVTSIGGFVAVDNITVVSDTQINAEMTALSPGTDVIKVTTRNGNPNTATINVALSSSKLAFTPGQLAISPGTSGTLTATISPSLTAPLTINLTSSAPTIASVPQTITIPASGSANLTVNALNTGMSNITSGGLLAVVFVTDPFSGDVNGLKSNNISVYIDAPAGSSPTAANPVSVYVDMPAGTSPGTTTASSVSAYVDAPPSPSPSLASPVSVTVDAPSGSSPTTTNPVSMKIQ